MEHVFSLLLFPKLQSGCPLAWLNTLLKPAIFAKTEKKVRSTRKKEYMVLIFNVPYSKCSNSLVLPCLRGKAKGFGEIFKH